MSAPMRYDHALMADHAAGQANQVTSFHDMRQRAMNVLAQTIDIWQGSGAGGYEAAQRQIDLAFQKVFETIGRHGQAIQQASDNAHMTDNGVGAGFQGI
ncbi:WXG100 family type VII secretion target [Mycobacteroides abscessus]|uniref:WXG100 family type VII secretion target n=1 Tax=Mycobacteroides abscessus TaxID=36809 RepID=UPI00040FEC97|nr:WXG100 family type VII secretion target [Mycobacteroides abscessus]MDO3267999.1 WXG100 family type VII secretion target [Mycobacteroides abscessus subsp. abscessus]